MATFDLTPIPHTSGAAVYVQVRDSAGRFLDPSAWSWGTLTVANWATFSVSATETPASSGYYIAAVDESAFTEGADYAIYYYERSGGTPASTDVALYLDEMRYADAATLSAVTDHIITLAEAKQHLRVSHSDQDTIIQYARDAAESFVKAYCGVDWPETSRTEYVNGGDWNLWLNHKPAVSITSVYDVEADSTIDSGMYRLWGQAAVRHRYNRWENDLPDRWRVIYVGGYGTTYTVPGELRQAVLHLISRAYDARGALVSDRSGDVTQEWAALVDSDIAKLLNMRRLDGGGF